LVGRRERLPHLIAKRVVVLAGVAPHAQHLEVFVDEVLVHQLVDRRQQLPPTEITERAEDDHRARIGAIALCPRCVRHRARRNDGSCRAHVVFTAWPPNSLRSAAMTLAPNESVWRERKRACSESVITGAGTSRSIASCTVQRPSPESATQPLIAESDASRANAAAASSLSHDRTTLPCCQTFAICSRSSDGNVFDACRIS